MRPSKRADDEMRSVSFERGVARYAEGSCLVRFGETHVLCAASLEEEPPPRPRGQGRGWVTAEYAMLPRATLTRTKRELSPGKVSGRSQEILAPHRPIVAVGRRFATPRRAANHYRLRCAAGGRRHPHRLHHGRVGRAARLPELDDAALDPAREPDQGSCRRCLVRIVAGKP